MTSQEKLKILTSEVPHKTRLAYGEAQLTTLPKKLFTANLNLSGQPKIGRCLRKVSNFKERKENTQKMKSDLDEIDYVGRRKQKVRKIYYLHL